MIRNLTIINFRILRELSAEFSSNKGVFFLGPNGSGKTSVLEALLAPGYGFLYGSKAKSVINKGKKRASVKYTVLQGKLKKEIKTVFGIKKSEVLISNKKTEKQKVRATVPFSWYFPQDISLVIGGPRERRKFLDEIASQVSKKYHQARKIYRKALRNRNKLLSKKNLPLGQLEVYEKQIAQTGAIILKKRLEILPELERDISTTIKEIMDFEVKIDYIPSWNVSEPVEKSLEEALYVSRETHRLRETTTLGPHRDDVRIRANGKNSRVSASYGEKKLISLSLKLAERNFLKKILGKNVIFIADDLFSELDEKRKKRVVNFLNNNEVYFFASATERAEFIHLDCDIVYMKEGEIEKIG